MRESGGLTEPALARLDGQEHALALPEAGLMIVGLDRGIFSQRRTSLFPATNQALWRAKGLSAWTIPGAGGEKMLEGRVDLTIAK